MIAPLVVIGAATLSPAQAEMTPTASVDSSNFATDSSKDTQLSNTLAGSTKLQEARQQILDETNAIRAEKGLKPVKASSSLNQIAQSCSEKQAANQQMAHCDDFADKYPAGWMAASENVAMGYSVDQVTTGWKNSPGHYANMTDPNATHLGIGLAYDSKGLPYYTQNFAGYSDGVPGESEGDASGADQGDATGGDKGDANGADQGDATGGDKGDANGADQGDATGGDQGDASCGDQGNASCGDQGGNQDTPPEEGESTGADQAPGDQAQFPDTIDTPIGKIQFPFDKINFPIDKINFPFEQQAERTGNVSVTPVATQDPAIIDQAGDSSEAAADASAAQESDQTGEKDWLEGCQSWLRWGDMPRSAQNWVPWKGQSEAAGADQNWHSWGSWNTNSWNTADFKASW